MRCWLETHPKKGVRFITQTTNPKAGDVWNKPKASTYMLGAGAMFLGDDGHVGWEGLSEYSNVKQYRDFVETYHDYPNMARIKEWIKLKMIACRMYLHGKMKFTVNGEVKEPTEADLERTRVELGEWRDCLQFLYGSEPIPE
jgi:hypothetical protein